MRFCCILLGMLLALPVQAVQRLIFENSTPTPNAIVQLNTGVTVQDDLTGESGEGTLSATATDDDLACAGAGLQPSPAAGLARMNIALPTAGTLTYYVDADFEYDGGTDAMHVQPGDGVTLDVTCFSSLIFSDGFQ